MRSLPRHPSGAPLLAARFPRAYLDVNREAWELDPTMFADTLPSFVNARSLRVRMGLARLPGSSPAARRSTPDASRGEAAGGRALPSLSSRAAAPSSTRPRRISEAICCSIATRCPQQRARSAARMVLISCWATAMARPARRASSRRPCVSHRAKFCRRAQRALCRRVHDRSLRQPAARPPRGADRDQPGALYGRTPLSQEAGVRAAGGGNDRADRPSRSGDAGVPGRSAAPGGRMTLRGEFERHA